VVANWHRSHYRVPFWDSKLRALGGFSYTEKSVFVQYFYFSSPSNSLVLLQAQDASANVAIALSQLLNAGAIPGERGAIGVTVI
jgi:hypothetical protein